MNFKRWILDEEEVLRELSSGKKEKISFIKEVSKRLLNEEGLYNKRIIYGSDRSYISWGFDIGDIYDAEWFPESDVFFLTIGEERGNEDFGSARRDEIYIKSGEGYDWGMEAVHWWLYFVQSLKAPIEKKNDSYIIRIGKEKASIRSRLDEGGVDIEVKEEELGNSYITVRGDLRKGVQELERSLSGDLKGDDLKRWKECLKETRRLLSVSPKRFIKGDTIWRTLYHELSHIYDYMDGRMDHYKWSKSWWKREHEVDAERDSFIMRILKDLEKRDLDEIWPNNERGYRKISKKYEPHFSFIGLEGKKLFQYLHRIRKYLSDYH